MNDRIYIPHYGGSSFRDISFTRMFNEYQRVASAFRSYFNPGWNKPRYDIHKLFRLSLGY